MNLCNFSTSVLKIISVSETVLSESKVLQSPDGDLIVTYKVKVIGHAKQ